MPGKRDEETKNRFERLAKPKAILEYLYLLIECLFKTLPETKQKKN